MIPYIVLMPLKIGQDGQGLTNACLPGYFKNILWTTHLFQVCTHMLQAWESQDEGSFKDALCTRGDGSAASSEPMMNVSALRASQKLLLWSHILAVPAQ